MVQLSSTGIPIEDCTLATCSIAAGDGRYPYIPNYAANLALVILFSIFFHAHIIQGIWYRTWFFGLFAVIGCLFEISGYGGRMTSYKNPFSMNAYLTQIISLTVGPAWISAAVYLGFTRIVRAVGRKHARLPPHMYVWLFMLFDLVSLTLQALGGGMAASALVSSTSGATGTNIMRAGLGFQVASMAVFMILAGDFTYRVVTNMRQDKELAGAWTWRLTALAGALAVAAVTVFIRCVYRVAELSEGWKGPLLADEGMFIALEGVMVVIATFALNIFHPGWAFRTFKGLPEKNESEGSSA